jgi:hypothetical protein
MKKTADYRLEVLTQVEQLLRNLDDVSVSFKASSEKWTPRQVIGHLIASGNNNQMKFTSLSNHSNIDVVGYLQDEWIKAQNYQAFNWQNLLNLWHGLNLHITHIKIPTPYDMLNHEISVNGIGPLRLDFIMSDDIEHLKHPINQALPSANLSHNFKIIY